MNAIMLSVTVLSVVAAMPKPFFRGKGRERGKSGDEDWEIGRWEGDGRGGN
jgi:hypothetical protein